jgi:hypothetical protein
VRVSSLPRDLVSKVARVEHTVEQHPEVVARRRVAVKVERARPLENAVEFDQADGHLDEVGHHLVLADARAQSGDDRAHRGWHAALVAGRVRQVGVLGLGIRSPVPGVLEGEQLGVALAPRLVLEDDVVVPVRVEWRVQVDEVNRLVRYVAPENVEVVAVVQDVGLHDRRVPPRGSGQRARLPSPAP